MQVNNLSNQTELQYKEGYYIGVVNTADESDALTVPKTKEQFI